MSSDRNNRTTGMTGKTRCYDVHRWQESGPIGVLISPPQPPLAPPPSWPTLDQPPLVHRASNVKIKVELSKDLTCKARRKYG